VVAGWPHSPRLPDAVQNKGAWKFFHDALYAAPQRKFPVLLLPGKDVAAELRRSGQDRGSRLVFGSEGDAVRALQRGLKAKGVYKGRVNGRMDVGTYRAWNAAGFRPAARTP
jgi:hypothetical protein